MWLLRGARQHRVGARAEAAALEREALAAPDALHGEDGLVGQLVALGVVDAERGELRLQVAGRDPDDDAPPGERVERGDRLRREEGVPVSGNEDVRRDAAPGRP